jgi:membrane protein YqaA with SNARE-associated domain
MNRILAATNGGDFSALQEKTKQQAAISALEIEKKKAVLKWAAQSSKYKFACMGAVLAGLLILGVLIELVASFMHIDLRPYGKDIFLAMLALFAVTVPVISFMARKRYPKPLAPDRNVI